MTTQFIFGAGSHPFTPTPNGKKRGPGSPSPHVTSPERPTKKTKEADSLRKSVPNPSAWTLHGLPNIPNRPLPPDPEDWLLKFAASRQAQQNDPKGKSRNPAERPNVSTDWVAAPQPRSTPEPPANKPGRFTSVEQSLLAAASAHWTHPHAQIPFYNPSASDLISKNQTFMRETLENTRDGLRNILKTFETAQSTLDKKLLEQHRILEDANGAKDRAESGIRKVQEVAAGLKRQNNAIEDRNADLLEKNKGFVTLLATIQREREEEGQRYKEELEQLHAAKEAAESLEDGATNDRKKAYKERDEAFAEVERCKESLIEAKAVVTEAVRAKKEAQAERDVYWVETERRQSELEALVQLTKSCDQELGLTRPSSLAGPSSFGPHFE